MMLTGLTNTTLAMKAVALIFINNKTHLLSSLIMIEYAAVIAVALLMKVLVTVNMETHIALFTLIILITESIAGLSLMISMIRTHGNELLKSSNLMK